jgi:hypothetical protein
LQNPELADANAVVGAAMAKHEKEESPMKAALASAATALPAVAKQATDDLFSAHNFDLDIDIVVPGRCFIALRTLEAIDGFTI